MSSSSQSFEASMRRLEKIVKLMEGGELPLEQALELFEEGTALVKSSSKLLDEAELKVSKLVQGAGGAPVETELEEDV